MNIIEIHFTGGILFMGVLFFLLLAVLGTGITAFIKKEAKWMKYSQDIATLALVWGILGQLIGLFAAFEGIVEMGSVSQAMLAGGLKISSYVTIYGVIIFVVGKILKIAFNFKHS